MRAHKLAKQARTFNAISNRVVLGWRLSSRARFHKRPRRMLRPRKKYTVFDLQQLKGKRGLK